MNGNVGQVTVLGATVEVGASVLQRGQGFSVVVVVVVEVVLLLTD